MAGRLGRGVFALLGASVAAAVLTDCREPTQITLEIKTDAICADVTETSINVGRLGRIESAPASTTTERCDDASGRIGSLVVVPSGDKSEQVTIRIITAVNKTAQRCIDDGFTGGCIVARRTLNYVPHTPLVLPIDMSVDCLDIPCEDTQTCFKGICVSAKLVDPENCAVPGGCGAVDAGTPDVGDSAIDQSVGGAGGTAGSGGTAGASGGGGVAGAAGATGGTDAGTDGAPCSADLDADPDNCGACNHSCLGGACTAGKCQPVTLFQSGDPVRIAVDATDVYVADFKGGLILKASKQGGSATPIATGQLSPRYVVLDGDTVYWSNYGNDAIMRVTKTGGTPTPVATVKVPFGFVILNGTIYATSYGSNGGLFSVPTSGGTPAPLVTSESWVQSVDTDGSFLYWVAVANNATLRKAPVTGGSPIPIGDPFAGGYAVKIDSTYAYVLFVGTGQANGEVRRITLADGQHKTLASGVDGPVDLAIDSTHAYFTEAYAKRVRRAPLDGSAAAEILHSSSGQPWGISVDSDAVYWTDIGEGVKKLAK